MSKTKGNVIDPLEAIEEFGADAVRFTLASAASSGPTVSVERGRMAGSRNFATKLWNAARFTLGAARGRERAGGRSTAGALVAAGPLDPLAALDAAAARRRTATSRPSASTRPRSAIYAFLWHELCDGYLEMVKPVLSRRRTPAAARAGARRAARAASRTRSRCCIRSCRS